MFFYNLDNIIMEKSKTIHVLINVYEKELASYTICGTHYQKDGRNWNQEQP